jgi:hypothetical protein
MIERAIQSSWAANEETSKTGLHAVIEIKGLALHDR